jgi:hypothetical protein
MQFLPGAVWERPALAKWALLIIEMWSHIDSLILKIGANCLQGDTVTVISTLQAVDSPLAQRAAIITAARCVLSPEDALVFEAVLHSTNASRNTRHKFSHHLWGHSDELPDALLLVDPRDVNLAHARTVIGRRKKGFPVSFPFTENDKLDRSKISVWMSKDFDESREYAIWSYKIIHALYEMVSLVHDGQSTATIRKTLLQIPLIRQRCDMARSKTSP